MENKDYVNPADGLLYCGKCRTPKQCKVTAFGRETVQYCTCKCEQERLTEEKARREEQKKRQNNAAKQRRAKIKSVDLFLKMDNGDRGHITGSISSREEKY